MANLLTAATTNGAGASQSVTGPCSVVCRGTYDGATAVVQLSDEDVAASFCDLDGSGVGVVDRLTTKRVIHIPCVGTYYLRAVVSGAGSSTSLTFVILQ